ncbi:cupin domain-containing protein [Christiangramia forsetii]|uniref:Secreted protein n=2 Tax=Christiangramia forsetii TaxID=411153 RepID=A0M009_CHRFK|nr:cupin domain-containing protein [Christiangramia forsetii]GGG45806.1 hypothetical protein GCM10011532_32200 [Christiangramia forsetii]CAL65954.1 secreted protein [Christiangramia forsetii KT0803]
MKYIKTYLIASILFTIPFLNLHAQDAAKIDPEHYKVEFENEQLRILRINYGPGEESVMHAHPEGVVVFLSDSKGEMKMEDGKTFTMDEKAGKVMWTPPTKHDPSNVSDKEFEIIQIELKNNGKSSGKKSLHLFELPEGVGEKQLNDYLKEMNKAISDEGYPEAGYHLYKITDENKEYKYFMEGIWPDSATYDKIHNSEKWKAAAEKGKAMFEKIQAQELYLKAEKVK